MKSCFCFNLKTGTVFIGCLFTVISLVYCILLSSRIKKTYRDDLPLLFLGLAGFSLLLIASIILIVGAIKESKPLLLPWIVIFSLGLTIYAGSRIYDISNGSHGGPGPGPLWFLIFLLVIIAINIFFVKVVIDFFTQLKENRPEEGNGRSDDLGAGNTMPLKSIACDVQTD